MILVPSILPVIDTHPRIVFVSIDIEITPSDRIPHWELGCSTHCVRIWRQLGALHEDRRDARLLFEFFEDLLDDAWLDNIQRHRLALRNSIEAPDVLATDDDETVLIHVETAAVEQHVFLGPQRVPVRRQDQNLILRLESGGDDRA